MNTKSIYTAIIMILGFVSTYAQTLDEELGFVYVKAEYLYETGRFEEAIVQYNQVIAKDHKFKDALLHRGWSKYKLAAYKGAKMDGLQATEVKGITAASAALMGRAASMMNDGDGAINNLSAAIALDDTMSDYYEWRAAIYEVNNELLSACKDYESAMNLGSKNAEIKAKSLCGITKTKPNSTTTIPTKDTPSNPNNGSNPTNNEPTKNPTDISDDEVVSSGEQEDKRNTSEPTKKTEKDDDSINSGGSRDSVIVDDSDPVVRDESIPLDDNTVNSFVIDEDLTIEVSGQELGKRKITDIPSILILADENGKVTISICVNKSGQVTKAEFNPALSTIAKKSLVSLAIRKSKEFLFASGRYDAQCGVMVFKIKGS
jgi:tetratricopeptide (TPR) repeat protein